MFLKIRISKSMPGKAIAYVTAKNITQEVQRRNLHSTTLPPEEEMRRTANRFGKWERHEERKMFSIIVSPNPADNPTEDQVTDITNAILDRYFSTIQCVIVLHRDKKGTADEKKNNPLLHSHAVGSIIDPITGKNIHFSHGQLAEIQRWADQYAYERYGWKPFSPTRERRSQTHYRAAALKAIAARGSYSWKADMISRIERHYQEAGSYQEFLARLKGEGIGVISSYRNRKTGEIIRLPELRFSIRYNGRLMAVKGSTISDNLSPSAMEKRFPEIGGDHGQIRRFTLGQQGYTPKQMGSGHAGRQPGSNSGQGQGGVSDGKTDFHCIICERDREICEMCSRFERWAGGEHERSARTR